jgi:hypothetical protein
LHLDEPLNWRVSWCLPLKSLSYGLSVRSKFHSGPLRQAVSSMKLRT